jgi:iron complex transport system permease protein
LSRNAAILTALFILLVAASIFSLCIGTVNLSISEILSALFSDDPTGTDTNRKIIFDIRLPRILNTVIVGAALSCSGLILQSLLKNNLAEPGLLGISSGAGLGAILIFILPLSLPFFFITPVSFIFAVSTTVLIFFIAKGLGGSYTNFISTNKIILAGIAISAVISSVNGFLLLTSGSSITQILFWLNGGFSGRGWSEFFVGAGFTFFGVIFAFLISKDLNVLSLGDELSVSLGLNLKKIQRVSIFLSSLLAASAVSIAGIITFVGLVVPNISKLLIGNDHRFTIPCSVLLGAIFVVTADIIARTVIAPSEIPVSIITSFIGGPVFIWLILKKKSTKDN